MPAEPDQGPGGPQGEDDPRRWGRWYALVLGFLAVQIALFTLLSRVYR